MRLGDGDLRRVVGRVGELPALGLLGKVRVQIGDDRQDALFLVVGEDGDRFDLVVFILRDAGQASVCRAHAGLLELLRDRDIDLRTVAADRDHSRAFRSRIVGLHIDPYRIASCLIAVIGRDGDPVWGVGAGLHDRRGPCVGGPEGDACRLFRSFQSDCLVQLADVRYLDLSEVSRILFFFAAGHGKQHDKQQQFCGFHVFWGFGLFDGYL